MKLWFGFSAEIDAIIIENFKGDLEKLKAGEYDSWYTNSSGKLAAVLLTD